MDKEKILLDFTVYLLLDIEELCSYTTDFFGQANRQDTPYGVNFLDYEKYIRQDISTKDILIDYNLSPNINSINDFLSNKEMNLFRDYLNDNFREGFPDSDQDGFYGGNTPLNLRNTDIVISFNNYLKLRNINQNIFISYYIQLLDTLSNDVIDKLKKETSKIENIAKTKELLDLDLSKNYIEDRREKYKAKLFESVENNIFQFKGFADEKGLYFDKNKTLYSYLEYLKKNKAEDSQYSITPPSIDNSLDYLIYHFLEYRLFEIDHFKNIPESDKKTFDNLSKLKKEKLNLIKYLSQKNFSNQEIDIIFNTLSNNEFSTLKIRSLTIKKQVDFFNFCYLFHVLDYYQEKEKFDFSKETSFTILLTFSPQAHTNFDKNMFSKYYKYIQGDNNKHNPFANIEKLVKNIETQLEIKKENLKPINL